MGSTQGAPPRPPVASATTTTTTGNNTTTNNNNNNIINTYTQTNNNNIINTYTQTNIYLILPLPRPPLNPQTHFVTHSSFPSHSSTPSLPLALSLRRCSSCPPPGSPATLPRTPLVTQKKKKKPTPHYHPISLPHPPHPSFLIFILYFDTIIHTPHPSYVPRTLLQAL